MTSKPHDALFKAAFESPRHAAGLFRAILPPAVRDAIVWETLAHEAGSFIDPELADRHSDLLFSVDLGAERAFLYLLLEHQSSNDHDMPLRMLVYLVRIWERFRKRHPGPLPIVIPLVVSHAPEGWTAPRAFHDLFSLRPETIPGLAQLVPSFSLLIDDLARVDNDELHNRALLAFPALALWALRDARDWGRLLANLYAWVGAVDEALSSPRGVQAVAQVLRYVALVAGDVRFEEFRATIIREIPQAREVAMTIAEELRQEGREEGRAEGRAEGREQGRAEGREQGREEALVRMLVKQLTLKFGRLSAGQVARIEAANEAELERYVEQVLTAETIEAVLARR